MSNATAEVAAPAAAPIVRALIEPRLKLVVASAADVGNQFAAVLPAGTSFRDAFKPEFWAHTAYKLRAGDTIAVHVDDSSFYGLLYVRHVAAPGLQKLNNRAVVAALAYTEFAELETKGADGELEAKWKGPHLKWCVIDAGGTVLKEGCGTKEEAAAWAKARASV